MLHGMIESFICFLIMQGANGEKEESITTY